MYKTASYFQFNSIQFLYFSEVSYTNSKVSSKYCWLPASSVRYETLYLRYFNVVTRWGKLVYYNYYLHDTRYICFLINVLIGERIACLVIRMIRKIYTLKIYSLYKSQDNNKWEKLVLLHSTHPILLPDGLNSLLVPLQSLSQSPKLLINIKKLTSDFAIFASLDDIN